MIATPLFQNVFSYGARVDIGKARTYNQDEVISCPELGFFAVCDGMGGLPGGGDTSRIIASVLPSIAAQAAQRLSPSPSPESAAKMLEAYVSEISNSISGTANQNGVAFGATLCCVWLVGRHAVVANIGDSRAYILPKYKHRLHQISEDHNAAAILVAQGELTRSQAIGHPSSSQLTRFLGMSGQALPQTYITPLSQGDRILLCSDGLYGMASEPDIRKIMRSSKSPARVCGRLIDTANAGGGRDNISTIYIKIGRENK